MLDLLEFLGFDFDSLDQGASYTLQQWLFPLSKPQSICSYMVHKECRVIVLLLGSTHCMRSYQRYHLSNPK